MLIPSEVRIVSTIHISVRVICRSQYTESDTLHLISEMYRYLAHLHEPQTDVPPDMDMHAIIYGYGPHLNPDIIKYCTSFFSLYYMLHNFLLSLSNFHHPQLHASRCPLPQPATPQLTLFSNGQSDETYLGDFITRSHIGCQQAMSH